MQEFCPICSSPLKLNGSIKECSRDMMHNVTGGYSAFQGNYNNNPSYNQPQNQGVQLGYPKIKIPEEDGLGYWKQKHCPYCNHPFRLYEAAVVSTFTTGKIIAKPLGPQFSLMLKDPTLTGPENTREMACYQCPKCQNTLPLGYESSINVPIAIIGGLSSGKTHYIAALLDQMVKGMMAGGTSQSSIQFFPQTQDTKVALQVYRESMEKLSQFGATPRITGGRDGGNVIFKPLVFRMEIQYKGRELKSRPVNLIFYDISGELIANDVDLAHSGWPVLRSQGFIYLADPMSMPWLRAHLPEKKKPKGDVLSVVSRYRTNEIFDRARRVILKHRRLPEASPFLYPVAFTISKSDLLDDAIPANERANYNFLKPVEYDGLAYVGDWDQNNQDIQTWLAKVGENGLVRSSLSCPVHHYFAVSATGNAPNEEKQFSQIVPRRCFDPLMWLLWYFSTQHQ